MKIKNIVMLFLATTVLVWGKIPVAAEAIECLADQHGKSKVNCRACHGDNMPAPGDTVSNDRCLVCHGNYAELTKKDLPSGPISPDPHNSHLGDIECTLCHRGHSPSTVYCLECHKSFALKFTGFSGE